MPMPDWLSSRRSKESQSRDAALWSKCPKCGEVLYRRDLAANAYVCTRCGHHFRMGAYDRISTIVDGDFVLYESNAIVEYLDEAYPGRGAPLFPGDAKRRATIRRLISEADNYFDKATDPIAEEAFHTKPEARDPVRLAKGIEALKEESALFTRYLAGDFLAGPLSAAAFALYPMVAFLERCKVKLPTFEGDALLSPQLRAWKARIEALPYFDKTYPPHWRAA